MTVTASMQGAAPQSGFSPPSSRLYEALKAKGDQDMDSALLSLALRDH
jgi:hypothetical protein